MLKTIKNIGSAINLDEIKDKAGGDSVVGNSIIGGSEVINQTNSIKRKNQAKTTKVQNFDKVQKS